MEIALITWPLMEVGSLQLSHCKLLLRYRRRQFVFGALLGLIIFTLWVVCRRVVPGFFQDETITILEAEKKIVSEEVDVITGYKAMINVYMNHGISPLSLLVSLSPGSGSFLHFLNPNKSCTTHKSLLWLIKGGIK